MSTEEIREYIQTLPDPHPEALDQMVVVSPERWWLKLLAALGVLVLGAISMAGGLDLTQLKLHHGMYLAFLAFFLWVAVRQQHGFNQITAGLDESNRNAAKALMSEVTRHTSGAINATLEMHLAVRAAKELFVAVRANTAHLATTQLAVGDHPDPCVRVVGTAVFADLISQEIRSHDRGLTVAQESLGYSLYQRFWEWLRWRAGEGADISVLSVSLDLRYWTTERGRQVLLVQQACRNTAHAKVQRILMLPKAFDQLAHSHEEASIEAAARNTTAFVTTHLLDPSTKEQTYKPPSFAFDVAIITDGDKKEEYVFRQNYRTGGKDPKSASVMPINVDAELGDGEYGEWIRRYNYLLDAFKRQSNERDQALTFPDYEALQRRCTALQKEHSIDMETVPTADDI